MTYDFLSENDSEELGFTPKGSASGAYAPPKLEMVPTQRIFKAFKILRSYFQVVGGGGRGGEGKFTG